MVGGHLGEIYKICRNFSEDEKRLALMTMPTVMIEEELERRSTKCSGILDKIYGILENNNIETLDQAEETLKALIAALKSSKEK